MKSLPREIRSKLKIFAGEGMADMFLAELKKERSARMGEVAKVREDLPVKNDKRVKWSSSGGRAYGWCRINSKHLRSVCPRKPPRIVVLTAYSPTRGEGIQIFQVGVECLWPSRQTGETRKTNEIRGPSL